MINILLATDSFNQVNGVSTTYKNILNVTKRSVKVIHPGMFKNKSFKLYPEVEICYQPLKVYFKIKKINPTHIHIATEGTIGLIARLYCKLNNIPYSSAYHTKFPEYLKLMIGLPTSISYSFLKKFHRSSKAVLVPSNSCKKELLKKGFDNLTLWTRGVYKDLIAPLPKQKKINNSKKIRVLSVGRLSKEKNIEELCILQDKFEITIVGDGPQYQFLKNKYKNISFLGYKFGKDLAKIYASHDVFCFTSETDTFGIVIIEALCNGLPVAAKNVTGPKDIIVHKQNGFLGSNLELSIIKCSNYDKTSIKKIARKNWSWRNAEKMLFNSLLK